MNDFEFMSSIWASNNVGPLHHFHMNSEALLALHALHGAREHRVPYCCLEPYEILLMIQKAASAPRGCFVEVGVFWGGSAHHLTAMGRAQGRKVFLYDTFEGMPYMDKEDVEGVPVGLLKVDEALVRKNLGPYPTIIKGVFPCEPLPPAPIAFAHIDVDAYRSTKETIAVLAPRMASGGIMWFDDTNLLEGARQAVRESFAADRIERCPLTHRWFVKVP